MVMEPVGDALVPVPVAVAVVVVVDWGVVEAPGLGTLMGWPAEEHAETTILETEDCSARGQACATHGLTFGTSSGFWQWHAKSVKDGHPSPCRALTRHDACRIG